MMTRAPIALANPLGHDPVRALRTVAIVVGAAALALAGCTKKESEKAATQTAARVNKEEITVHQINFVLSQQRALAPEQAASAGRQVLEGLIDQELVLQKAADQKLDREPRVVQQIEAARKEIIARAYAEKVGAGAPKPTPQEVSNYYETHPGLFKERRIYSLQEVNVEAKPEQIETLKKVLGESKSLADFVNYLKTNGFRYGGNEAVRAAEQLPLASVESFAKLKDGQAVVNPRPGGLQVVYIAGSRSQPVAAPQATPAIEQFLVNERKRRLIADDVQAMRSAAKIEYVGDFAADAARSPYQAPSAPELPPLTSVAPPLPAGSTATAAPQIDVRLPEGAPASMPSGAILDRGLKGMK